MASALAVRAEIEPGMRLVLYRCPVKSCRRSRWCLTSTVERPVIRGTAMWHGDSPYCRNPKHRAMPVMLEESVQVLGDDLTWAAYEQAGATTSGGSE